MKNYIVLVFSLICCYGFAQDVLMQNGTVTTCSGTFYDSGGVSSEYGDNENFILTICPDQPEGRIKLEFQEFSTQSSFDVMGIYDGNDTSSMLLAQFSGSNAAEIVAATSDNSTGCLTILFISNNTGNMDGWAAEISCIMPCQEIIAQLDSTIPEANDQGIIEVCRNENITLNGSGIFEVDGAGATYIWDLGGGNTLTGQTIDISYDIPGVYFVSLEIRDTNTDNVAQGCPNMNSNSQIIRVSGDPDFSATQATASTLCFGESTTIEGVANPQMLFFNCPPPESELTFLPDGNGAAYETSITVTCFDPAEVLTDVNQIESICLNMEHSYLGDLDIEIISPNGQVVRLHDQGGASANLGIPWATGSVDGQSGNTTAGTGSDYCFVPSGGFPTLVGGIQTGGTFPNGDGASTYNDSFVPAGNYSSVNSLQGLIGSPLNGNWTVRIVDNIGADNGYIFSWELNFDNVLQVEDFSFLPTMVSQSWDVDPSITEVNGNTITVAPESAGENCYTYRVVDVFGCEYTEVVCINVAAEGENTVTYYEDTDGDGYGDADSPITVNCSEGRPEGFVGNNFDCNDTDGSINPDATDTEGNGIDENCDGVDGLLLGVNEFDANSIKVVSNPFNERIIINAPTSLMGSKLNISIYDLNGRAIYNNDYSVTANTITIDNLSSLEKSTYFLKIFNAQMGLNVVKKLIKM